MNKITDVQISCVNRVIIWSQTKSSENWMPALHRGTTHKEKGQPLPMQGCVPMKTSPCLILVYVFSFATGQKLYVSHTDSTCQCWYQSLRWVLHAAGLLVAIQSIHDFRNINSSSKQLPQPHPRLRYTSKCYKSEKISYAHPPARYFYLKCFVFLQEERSPNPASNS